MKNHQYFEEHPLGARPMEKASIEVIDPSFADFLAHLKKADIDVFAVDPNAPHFDRWNKFPEDAPEIFIMSTYKTGGTRGENGGESSCGYQETDLPKFQDYIRLLNLFWPDVPNFLKEQLDEAVVQVWDWNVNEYYGDSSNYRCETVDLQKMFQILRQENRLTPVNKSAPVNRFAGIVPTKMVVLTDPPKKLKR